MNQPKFSRNVIESNGVLTYCFDKKYLPGIYIFSQRFIPEVFNYFQLEVIKYTLFSNIIIGAVSSNHPLEKLPGRVTGSIGFQTSGNLILSENVKRPVVDIQIKKGDKIGCGIRFNQSSVSNNFNFQQNSQKANPSFPLWTKQQYSISKSNQSTSFNSSCYLLFFTLNDFEIASVGIASYHLEQGLYPSIGFSSSFSEVMVTPLTCWNLNFPSNYVFDDYSMCIDTHEDDWQRLHFIRLNGSCLEYTGRGKNLFDRGLAQAKRPLTTCNYFFEMEIIDPGQNCYIAIGLTEKNYPYNSHPGWNKGSIAYHADDGKLFLGKSLGYSFGPKCNKGDIMGCGIRFPVTTQITKDILNYDFNDGMDDVKKDLQNDEVNALKNLEQMEHCDLESDCSSLDFDNDITSSSSSSNDEFNAKITNESPVERELKALAKAFPIKFLEDKGIHIKPKPKSSYLNETEVEVFFTRNGSLLGHRRVPLPKGGFYPTVGMMSASEKVKVELYPLSG